VQNYLFRDVKYYIYFVPFSVPLQKFRVENKAFDDTASALQASKV